MVMEERAIGGAPNAAAQHGIAAEMIHRQQRAAGVPQMATVSGPLAGQLLAATVVGGILVTFYVKPSLLCPG
jgi:hypothetical protein